MKSYADVMVFLKNLGLAEGLDSFSDRIRVQKAVYLLKQFGADLNFGYTWYIRGPYSPSLTSTLFNPTKDDLRMKRKLTAEELNIVNDMRNFLGGDFYSAEKMELMASLIYLIKHGPEAGLTSKGKIVKFLKEQKPQYSQDQIEGVLRRIAKSGIWNGNLGKLH